MDIEMLLGGVGLASGPAPRLLGEPSAGRSSDLDALAAFVLRGTRVSKAAPGDATVIQEGRDVYEQAGCAACHSGPAWTVSALPGEVGTLALEGELEVRAVLHDVDTFNPETDVLGEHGFDVPTLLGLHATAPYLHDGSARTLVDVLANPKHAPALSDREKEVLELFLLTIDETTPLFSPH